MIALSSFWEININWSWLTVASARSSNLLGSTWSRNKQWVVWDPKHSLEEKCELLKAQHKPPSMTETWCSTFRKWSHISSRHHSRRSPFLDRWVRELGEQEFATSKARRLSWRSEWPSCIRHCSHEKGWLPNLSTKMSRRKNGTKLEQVREVQLKIIVLRS